MVLAETAQILLLCLMIGRQRSDGNDRTARLPYPVLISVRMFPYDKAQPYAENEKAQWSCKVLSIT